MDGKQKFHNLKETLFSNKAGSYPEYESLSKNELSEKAGVAFNWLQTHRNHPKYDEARKKYNWIVYYLNKTGELTPDQIFGYLL